MIKINNATYAYREGEPRVKALSLTVRAGECVLLCGRSGCGKTTVTRLINGLIPHFYPGQLTGSVMVAGRNIAQTPLYEIAEQTGSVFQNPRTQFFNVDTDSEIAFGLERLAYPAGELRKRVAGTAADLAIEHLLGRNIFELSGGEKQKIALASAYALSPDIYVLDEPSSNLDVQAIDDIRRILLFLKEQGKTIVIAEHRLYYLSGIADRLVYLEGGSIAGEYTVEQFLAMDETKRSVRGLRTMDLAQITVPEKRRSSDKPSLEIKELTLNNGSKTVLQEIDLNVSRGEIVGILGRNGAGKTTFSQVLCGLKKQSGGMIVYQGRPVTARQRLRLSYLVMQDVNYQLFAGSVEEECTLGKAAVDRGVAGQVLKKLGFAEYRQCHPMALSGGQKQRTAIAASILCNKEILIFDEPTSGLDLDSMKQVTQLLAELAALGKTIFVVTHDYEFVSAVCERVIYFEGGKIKDDFTVSQQHAGKLRDYFCYYQSGEVNRGKRFNEVVESRMTKGDAQLSDHGRS